MLKISKDDLKKIHEDRRRQISQYLKNENLGAAVFIDNETHRDPAVRYFTGHPNDALLIIFANEKSVLIPWDEILAKKYAFCDKIIPFARYKNNDIQAVQANLNAAVSVHIKKAVIPPYVSYPNFLKFIDALSGWDILCKEDGVHQFAIELRTKKDDYEIACIREAARIGDLIIDKMEEAVRSGRINTEIDAALFIEKELRENGCERTGFDTLVAGPARSWAIHCFPNYTQAQWPGDGLSIIDFGVVYNGYTSDTTVTIAKGNLSDAQEQLLKLVQASFDECLNLYKPGLPVKSAAERADEIFAAAKKSMPHTLGHGIGLEVHEFPRVSTRFSEEVKFKPGMVVTLEPGLYDENLGGVRLENDILITDTGNEVLTHSRIIRL